MTHTDDSILAYTSDDGHNILNPDDCNCAQCQHDYLYHGFKMDETCYTCFDKDCPHYDPYVEVYNYDEG